MTTGIREVIKRHATLFSVLGAVALIAAVGYSLRSATSGGSTAVPKMFCTIDDGQTCFVADLNRIPPFDYQGKTANRVWMYTCDGGKTKFAGYVERFTPEAKKRLDEAAAAGKLGPALAGVGPGDTEIKKPGGGSAWVSRTNQAEAARVLDVTCPKGGDLDVVMP